MSASLSTPMEFSNKSGAKIVIIFDICKKNEIFLEIPDNPDRCANPGSLENPERARSGIVSRKNERSFYAGSDEPYYVSP